MNPPLKSKYNKEKIEESKTVERGSRWLYLEESVAEEPKEEKKEEEKEEVEEEKKEISENVKNASEWL